MPMLRFISKGSIALLVALLVGGCRGNAHTQDEDAAGFVYRGLYTPSNTKEIQAQMHVNHPDYDWGLWGHNLKKVVGDKATDAMFSIVDGKRNKNQFCFSSSELYDFVRAYILDLYGCGTDDYSERISIMPMDNKMACTCEACRQKGNTRDNATPAVTAFVTRLAKEFPKHQFFTSAYHTTKSAPVLQLPDNVGVFVSSIALPMCVDFKKNAGYREFDAMVKAWQKKCKKIYVWDYERNYDDYLSPFPCLLVMQQRLELYRQLGIKGVFVNGSGDDYSAFDDMQTHVLALLLDNPGIDVHQAISDYFAEYYPQTAKLLTAYYWGLESRIRKTNHQLPLYGTMDEMYKAYLEAEEFKDFRSLLDVASKQTSGDERKRLNALLTSLAYTQLELYRTGILPKDGEMVVEMKEILKGHAELKGMKNLDEVGHSIDDYLNKWRFRSNR